MYYITPFPFLPPSFPTHPSSPFWKFRASFFTTCYCIYACICIYSYIPNTTCSVCVMLLVYFQGWLCSQFVCSSLEKEDQILHCWISSVAYNCLYRVERPGGFLPSSSTGVILVQLMSGQSWWRDFMGLASDITKINHLLYQIRNSNGPLAFTIFPLRLLLYFLSRRCGSVLLMCPWKLGSTPLQFDWVWYSKWSLSVAKRTFLYEWWRLYLSIGLGTDVYRLLSKFMLA